MSERTEIERVIRQAYAARKSNNLEECLKVFADNPIFRMAGTPVTSPVTTASRNGEIDLRAAIGKLIASFEWIDHTIVSIVIDGSRAAVHGRVKMESIATGDVVETDVADFIEVRDGRITSFVEFCDTALVARLMGR
jgi:ketosteroid isomerase-like protein